MGSFPSKVSCRTQIHHLLYALTSSRVVLTFYPSSSPLAHWPRLVILFPLVYNRGVPFLLYSINIHSLYNIYCSLFTPWHPVPPCVCYPPSQEVLRTLLPFRSLLDTLSPLASVIPPSQEVLRMKSLHTDANSQSVMLQRTRIYVHVHVRVNFQRVPRQRRHRHRSWCHHHHQHPPRRLWHHPHHLLSSRFHPFQHRSWRLPGNQCLLLNLIYYWRLILFIENYKSRIDLN